ncbi:low-affinity Cu transporter PWA37_002389 [Arxiozyma heterogenica]|uniref:low-affinity Cu transporter n=1 Tax=Arxiozyma heterogenica TaxID=278026 RepID=UPI002F0F5DAA
MNHHTDMDMDTCSMNMSFTWSYNNTCIIFSWWKINTGSDLLLSCMTLVVLSILYEWFKYRLQLYNSHQVLSLPLNSNTYPSSVVGPNKRMISSCLYGCQVGFSFLLMLVFMTYSGWLMLSVLIGATIGHYWFGYRLHYMKQQQQHQQQASSLLETENSLACH